MAPAEALRVSVVYSPQARVVDEIDVKLPAGSTLVDAVRASGIVERHPGLDISQSKIGIWGRVQPLETVLRDRDRIEIYRPLRVDPKEARRLRYRKVGKLDRKTSQGA
jgi:putative ubiquitin-RnfH superfamily antitoxin RatB of RatAB toxin-antitoxin module